MIETIYRNYTLYIGENKEENDALVRQSDPNDIWAHISNYPSAHGVIRNPSGKKVPNTIIKRVCCIIKSKSNKCKSIKSLQFDICKICDVTLTDKVGMVTVNNIKNIYI